VVWAAVVDWIGGAVVVCVAVALVAGPPLVEAPVVEVEVDVCEELALALALSGGTCPPDCGAVTVACVPVPEASEASDPDWAGAELDFTALPIPKPAAIAITSSIPSSHHRRSIVVIPSPGSAHHRSGRVD
jgi:hypothetical protein